MANYFISVLIPVYNRAAILPDAIDSVLSQAGCDPQIIVVDDGSSDDIRAVQRRYNGEQVRWVHQENHGVAYARNRAFELAEAEYVAFLDSDDVWLPGRALHDRQLFQRFPSADVVVTDCELWMENHMKSAHWLTDRLDDSDLKFAIEGPEFVPEGSLHWLKGKQFPTCSMIMRRTALEQIGTPLYDEGLRVFEDWDLEIRLLRHCRVLVSRQVFSRVRLFDDGTRVDRPAMRRPPNSRQYRLKLQSQLRVIGNTIALGGWTRDVEIALQQRQAELSSMLQASESLPSIS